VSIGLPGAYLDLDLRGFPPSSVFKQL
jgi:hypothetical protein